MATWKVGVLRSIYQRKFLRSNMELITTGVYMVGARNHMGKEIKLNLIM